MQLDVELEDRTQCAYILRILVKSRFGKTALQKRTKYWVDHEIVSRDMFDAILKQDAAQNLEVRRSACG